MDSTDPQPGAKGAPSADQRTADHQAAADGMRGAAASAAGMARDGVDRARTAFEDHVVEPARRAGEAIKASGQRLMESGSVLGGKVVDQAEANAREAFAAMRSATQARDWSEVMRIQAEYLRDQGQRSLAQAREVGELIIQFGREAVGSDKRDDGPPAT